MIEVNDLQEFTSMLDRTKVVIVDAYATWCGPCQWIAPKIEHLDRHYGSSVYGDENVKFVKVDVDKGGRTIATKLRISAMPTFLIFVNGEQVDRLSGANYKSLKHKIEQVLSRELEQQSFKPMENDPHENETLGTVLGGVKLFPTVLLLVLLLGYLVVNWFGDSGSSRHHGRR